MPGFPKWNWNFIINILSNDQLEFDEKKINKLIESGFQKQESSNAIATNLFQTGLQLTKSAIKGTVGSRAFANQIVNTFFKRQLANELNGNEKLADYLVSKFSRREIEKIIKDNDLISRTATAAKLSKSWEPPSNKKSAQNSLDRALNNRARYMLNRIQKENEEAARRVKEIKVRRALKNSDGTAYYRYVQGFKIAKANLPTVEEFRSLDTESKLKLLEKIEEIYKNDYRTKVKRRNRIKKNLQINPGYNWVLSTDKNFNILPDTLAEESDPLLANLVNEEDYNKLKKLLKDEYRFTKKELAEQEPEEISNPNFDIQTNDNFDYDSEDYTKLPIDAPYDLGKLSKLKPDDFRDKKTMKEFFAELGKKRKEKWEKTTSGSSTKTKNNRPLKAKKPLNPQAKRRELRKNRAAYWRARNTSPQGGAIKLAKSGFEKIVSGKARKATKARKAKKARKATR